MRFHHVVTFVSAIMVGADILILHTGVIASVAIVVSLAFCSEEQ